MYMTSQEMSCKMKNRKCSSTSLLLSGTPQIHCYFCATTGLSPKLSSLLFFSGVHVKRCSVSSWSSPAECSLAFQQLSDGASLCCTVVGVCCVV